MAKFSWRRAAPLVFVVLLFPRSVSVADAQISQVVYEDLKSILEDLITGEIATTTSAEVVCRAGHVEIPSPTDADWGQPDVVKIDEKAWRLSALQHYPTTFSYVYRRQFGALQTSIRAESAALAGYLIYQSVHQLWRDDSPPAPPTPTDSKLRATRTLLDSSIARFGVAGAFRAETVFADDLGAACRTQVKAKLARGIPTGPTPLDEACAASSTAEDRLACSLARALQSAVMDDGRTSGHLEAAAAVIVSQALQTGLASAGTLTIPDLRAFESQVRTYLAAILARPEDFKASSTALLAEVMNSVVVKTSGDSVAARIQELEAAVATAELTLRQLAATWRRVAGASERGDVIGAIDALVSSTGVFRELCTKLQGSAFCTRLQEIETVIGRQTRWMALLRAAGDGDLRQIAAASFEALLPRTPDTSACAGVTHCTDAIYQRFAMALVYYVIDVAEEKTPSDGTRAAFRSAALELIRGVSVGGYDRASRRSMLYPDFALRAAWSAGHIDEEGETLRYVASASWLTWRRPWMYNAKVYVATHTSLADPIAPLAELALRSNAVTYRDSEKLLVNLFTPRLDVAIGIPALSRHLTINAGAALHLVAPYQAADGNYEYRWYGQADVGTRLSQGLQLSIAINYVP